MLRSRITVHGPAVSEKAKTDAEAAKAKLKDDTLDIYKGPMKDNTGKGVIPAGKVFKQKDPELESMTWLVDGVLGSTKS
jgi:basic membrane protein A and related proteins